eukprot:6200653-Pleurochrysis_carterae.AAC.2
MAGACRCCCAATFAVPPIVLAPSALCVACMRGAGLRRAQCNGAQAGHRGYIARITSITRAGE